MALGLFCLLFFLVPYQIYAQEPPTKSTNNSLLDKLIGIIIVFFILSMIVERITDFIKLNIWENEQGKLFFWGLFRTKQPSELLEKKRERNIQRITFITAILVAILSNANLIQLISSDDPSKVLGLKNWGNTYPLSGERDFTLMPLIGCMLTSFFISVGSKFWHDMLDLLLQIKNFRRKLNDSRTFDNPQSVNQITEFIQTPEFKLAQIALDQNSQSIRSIPGVLTVGRGYTLVGGQKTGCIEVHVADAATAEKISKDFPITLSSGLTVPVPVVVMITGSKPVTHSLNAALSIGNKTKNLGLGTLGGFFKDTTTGEHYILSCFHVLNSDSNWTALPSTREIVLGSNGTQTIAEMIMGFRTDQIDAAIALIKKDTSISNDTIKNPKAIRKIETKDAINETPVRILGAKTGSEQKGIIYNDSWDTELIYSDNNPWLLKDLLVLTNKANGSLISMTQQGDSGALVIDNSTNKVVGMVVGGDNLFTYAIKMDKIAQTFGITLV